MTQYFFAKELPKMNENLKNQQELLESEILEERGRLSTDRMDISFGELINLYKNKELIIRPEYQRFFRWTSRQKTAFIESILLSIPIPPIFVMENEEGIWELIDGLHRVLTFISFFGELDTDAFRFFYPTVDSEENNEISIENKWLLESGSLVSNLDGFNIDTLPNKYKINLKRAVCRVEILRSEGNVSMKYELFKRLNLGGSKLTAQEIRNAIYRGINPAINELILELSQHQTFQKLTRLSEQKRKELYDQELVLRFIAFLNNIDIVNGSTENYLDSFMEYSVKQEGFNIQYYRNIFNKVMDTINKLDDKDVFRTSNNLFVPSYFEGITIGLAQNLSYYEGNIELLRSKITALKNDDEMRRISGTNSKWYIKKRLKRANEIFSSVNNE